MPLKLSSVNPASTWAKSSSRKPSDSCANRQILLALYSKTLIGGPFQVDSCMRWARTSTNAVLAFPDSDSVRS